MSIFNKICLILLAFIPITLLASYGLHASGTIIFFLAALAVIPLAKFIGEATEELAIHLGPAQGGLLNAAFGNATELLIGVFAIKAGLLDVVKASLTGSIIGNLLLVLGTAMLAGGWKYKKQEFNKTAALSASATLLLFAIALIMPAIFLQTAPQVSRHAVEEVSILVAVFLLMIYVASLWFSLHTHKHLYIEEVGKLEARWTQGKSIMVLGLATVAAAWMSELLVQSIGPVVQSFGWSQLFIGVIFIAIIGNVTEHISAVTTAVKNRMDLSLQISIGSATQIAMFVAPLLVLLSLFFKNHMNLVFNLFEVVAIVASILIANLVMEDGESNWFEGAQLLMVYCIMAVVFSSTRNLHSQPMALQYATRGFVFKKSDINEADRVFSVFTEDFGRVEVFGKAIRNVSAKLRGGIDMLYISDISFVQGRNRKTLIDAKPLKKFAYFNWAPAAARAAGTIVAHLDEHLKGSQQDATVLSLLEQTFLMLEANQEKAIFLQLLECYFVWNFCASQGKKPELQHCASCKKPLTVSRLYFSFGEGGTVCVACGSRDNLAVSVSADAVKVLRLLLKQEMPLLERLRIQPAAMRELRSLSADALKHLYS